MRLGTANIPPHLQERVAVFDAGRTGQRAISVSRHTGGAISMWLASVERPPFPRPVWEANTQCTGAVAYSVIGPANYFAVCTAETAL